MNKCKCSARELWSRYVGLSPVVKSSIWYTICNFLQRGMALITVPIFTRMLTTDEYGICGVYFTWFEIFVLFTSLKIPFEGLNNGLIRYEEDKDGYTSAVLGLITTMTIGWMVIYILFQEWIQRALGLNSILMCMMMVQVMFNPPLYLWLNRERFDYCYRWPVMVTVLSTILSPVISIGLLMFTDLRAEGRVIGVVLVQGIFGAILYAITMFRGRRFFVKEYWRFAALFNLPLLAFYLSQTILSAADRIMIQQMIGNGPSGIYNVGYSAATILLLLTTAVNGSINPWMYRKLKAGEYGDIPGVIGKLGMLFAVATLIMCMLTPDLIYILASSDYKDAIWIVPPVTASVFFTFLYMLFANVEMYYDHNKGIAVVSILAALANIVLNALAIPIWGYMAAGWTTLICYILLAIMHYVLMLRACRGIVDGRRLFPGMQMILQSLLVILMVFLGLGLYRLGIWRYLILLILCIGMFLFRKRILSWFREMKK